MQVNIYKLLAGIAAYILFMYLFVSDGEQCFLYTTSEMMQNLAIISLWFFGMTKQVDMRYLLIQVYVFTTRICIYMGYGV